MYGYHYADDFLLGREHFAPLAPGTVNIIGLDKKAGYFIIIENRAAKLVYSGSGGFAAGPMDNPDASSGDKKFVPIKDMLAGLQGNVEGLSHYVERLNEITAADDTPDAPVWKIEDVEKAVNGDAALTAKLVHDLNVNLDGTPIDRVSKSALQNGILIDTPVAMKIPGGKSIYARVRRGYSPILMKKVLDRLKDKFYGKEAVAREYAAAAAGIKTGETPKEDVKKSLLQFKSADDLAGFPQRILDSITTIVNDRQITLASYSTQTTPKGNQYTLIINLTDEGRKRLWQFARNHEGDQLLLTVDGVAIAAPFIGHATDLAGGQIEINGMEDESLVQDAVNTINEKRATTSQ